MDTFDMKSEMREVADRLRDLRDELENIRPYHDGVARLARAITRCADDADALGNPVDPMRPITFTRRVPR